MNVYNCQLFEENEMSHIHSFHEIFLAARKDIALLTHMSKQRYRSVNSRNFNITTSVTSYEVLCRDGCASADSLR